MKNNILIWLSCTVVFLVIGFFIIDSQVIRTITGLNQNPVNLPPAQRGLTTEVSANIVADNADFKVEQIGQNQFTITIKTVPYNAAKEKAEKWLTDKGYSKEKLCSNVYFYPAINLKSVFAPTPADLVPSGCPVSKPKPPSS